MQHNYVLIIAGGAGTRLWPLSRKARPKQFQSFSNQHTLLQGMVGLAERTVPLSQVFVLVTPEFRDIVGRQLPALPPENLLSDPMRKDTGPAFLLGMLSIKQRDPDAVVAVLWSDHHIQEPAVFADTLAASFKAAADYPNSLITVGAKPTAPDTGLGYIQMEKEVASYGEVPLFRAKRFIEKPDQATAQKFVRSWEYLWNTGYAIMGVKSFVKVFKKVQPDLAAEIKALEKAVAADDPDKIAAAYAAFPKLAIDYLFTQHLDDFMVIPSDMGWSDIGNWNTLHDVLKGHEKDELYVRGAVTPVNTSNCLVFAKDRPIVTVGLHDVIIVDDGDVILVMAKNQAQAIKQVVASLEEHNPELL